MAPSSLKPYLSPQGETGGSIASNVARDIFARHTTEPLGAVAQRANEEINHQHESLKVDTSDGSNRFATTAAVVKFNQNFLEVLQISDSVVIVQDQQGNVTTPVRHIYQDIEVMKKWRQLADRGAENIRILVAEMVYETRRNANRGYSLLNGDTKLTANDYISRLPLENISRILLLTDGLFIPKADPEIEEDWKVYIDICRKQGLSELFRIVREVERSDPTLTDYPRFKISDDATGIFIELTKYDKL